MCNLLQCSCSLLNNNARLGESQSWKVIIQNEPEKVLGWKEIVINDDDDATNGSPFRMCNVRTYLALDR